MASTVKLNTKKTKIFGFGKWQGRVEWPYPDLKVETANISILGITYGPNIDQAADICWSGIVTAIKQRAALLSQRYFTNSSASCFDKYRIIIQSVVYSSYLSITCKVCQINK